jgi:membrane-bound serine protease (ClpP class)
MKNAILTLVWVFVSGLFTVCARAETLEIERISLLSVNSAITPATYDYLQQNFKTLSHRTLVIIRLNTPGGLVTTTKDIITLIGKENRPVVIWITPEGASASSAGAIIAAAAHFIFMAPGTNMGAATPVGLGEDIKEGDGRKKALNDLTAMVRSLSEQRGRPAAPFEDMIRNAKSYTDREAFKLKIINGISSNLDDLIHKVNGSKVRILGKDMTISVTNTVPTSEIAPSVGQMILEVLANPSTAYFLFLIGVALIYFEIQAPGGFIAGAVGAGFLVLAAIAFQVLPLNWGALGLILLGVLFFIMEIFITSYGILSLAGLGSFVLGSLFLFNADTGFIRIDYPVLLSTLAGVFSSVGFIVWYLLRDMRRQKRHQDFFLPEGSTGVVMSSGAEAHYQVKVRGEIWKAQAAELLSVGDRIVVETVDRDHLILKVKKA